MINKYIKNLGKLGEVKKGRRVGKRCKNRLRDEDMARDSGIVRLGDRE